MNLLISTNMYRANEFEKVFDLIDGFSEYNLGVEVFPMFQEAGYEEVINRSVDRLQELPVSFHGPYYGTEHSAPEGTELYEASMSYLDQAFRHAAVLHSQYLVFHHNNGKVTIDRKGSMLRTSQENLKKIDNLAKSYGVPLVVENAGVKFHDNMLLDQEEFISWCRSSKYPVLVDIGHAHANGWNLKRVMELLKDQIISYHIHNNDGIHDSHRRIFDGRLDMEQFLRDYEELTPNADLVLEYSEQVEPDTDGIRDDIGYLLNRFSGAAVE